MIILPSKAVILHHKQQLLICTVGDNFQVLSSEKSLQFWPLWTDLHCLWQADSKYQSLHLCPGPWLSLGWSWSLQSHPWTRPPGREGWQTLEDCHWDQEWWYPLLHAPTWKLCFLLDLFPGSLWFDALFDWYQILDFVICFCVTRIEKNKQILNNFELIWKFDMKYYPKILSLQE